MLHRGKWSQWRISRRIMAGFLPLMLLIICAGILSIIGINTIIGNAEKAISGNRLDGILAQKVVDHLNWANKVNTFLTDSSVATLEVELDDHKCGFGKWLYGEDRKEAERLVPGLVPSLKDIEQPHQELHKSAEEIGALFHRVDPSLGKLLRDRKIDHLNWTHRVKDLLLDRTMDKAALTAAIEKVEKDPTKCGLGKWLSTKEVEDLKTKEPGFAVALKEMEEPHKNLHGSIVRIAELLTAGQYEEAQSHFMNTTKNFAVQTLKAIDNAVSWHDTQVTNMQNALGVYATKTVPALSKVQASLTEIRQEAKKSIISDETVLKSARNTQYTVLVVTVLAVLLGAFLAVFISRGISRHLEKITAGVQETASYVTGAAGEVKVVSQSLSEISSHHAATVEQTSAAVEQISVMSRETLDLTTGSEKLMRENIEKSAYSLKALIELTTNLTRIEQDSDRISQIIKTIDNIAFQTNLLALNAAVEAARAGEAGAGFAVVATEVKTLAMRVAEAAKSTQELLDGTVERVKQGAQALRGINTDFENIVETATKMGDKTAAITLANTEQTKGIEQISIATGEIDKVSSQVASTSEEAAAAALHLADRAEELKVIVRELARIVHGNAKPGQEGAEKTAPKFIT